MVWDPAAEVDSAAEAAEGEVDSAEVDSTAEAAEGEVDGAEVDDAAGAAVLAESG